ncbi:DUF72 domain-containing protein [Actinoallomurus bryophytorum]|uniref:Uncharacterized protein YecE (DUF72 family) n=1 Tax=Actinoallomurus bryophytorum TaxID=1490222 RepID=A0A543CNY2_9ACTN|nr:DUF72 domain-containing protein [Actinoallomurus bryophytorum]TQL98818.1 uncharacterized protein YecE (DUF72 family) [Actinoallomurus bryophytorum]
MPILVGTSGWQYKDWRGLLYPPGLAQNRWLATYASGFGTVENNNAFYRLPAPELFERWRDLTPPDFVMAVKASRYLTHIKRLVEPEEPVERLMNSVRGLGDRLGPILVQLPPTLRAEPERLDRCLRAFPPGVRVAVEPRHVSWWTDEVRGLLTERGAALCWADRLGRPVTPLWRTTGWGYVRFHEGAASPWPEYGDQALRSWVRRVGDLDDVYAYFNNDPGGAAVRDAIRFAGFARAAGLRAGRTPEPSLARA